MLSRNITLIWHQCHFTKTMPLDPRTSVGLIYSVPDTNEFKAFLVGILVKEEPRVFKMLFLPPDEDNASFQLHNPIKPNKELREPSNKAEWQQDSQTWKKNENPNPHLSKPDMDTNFILDGIKRIHDIETGPETATLTPKDELLR